MTNTEFLAYVTEKMEEGLRGKYPEARVQITSVRRKNRHREDSIIFRLCDSDYGIAMYLEDLYEIGKGWADTDEGIKRLLEDVESRLLSIKPENIVHCREWNDVKNYITASLLREDEAVQLQEEFPSRRIQGTDLFVFYGIGTPSDNEQKPIPVDNNMLRAWNVNEAELYEQAVSHLTYDGIKMSALSIFRERLVELDIYLEEVGELRPGGFFYTLTTDDSPCGAAALLVPGILEKLSNKFKTDFKIIPLSDQVLLLFSADESPDYIQSALMSMNAYIRADEFLSEKIYAYKNGDLITLPEEWTDGNLHKPDAEEGLEEEMED